MTKRIRNNRILLLCVSIIVIKFSTETGCVQPKRPEQNAKFLLYIYIKVLGIGQVQGDKIYREVKESLWIKKLRTEYKDGTTLTFYRELNVMKVIVIL